MFTAEEIIMGSYVIGVVLLLDLVIVHHIGVWRLGKIHEVLLEIRGVKIVGKMDASMINGEPINATKISVRGLATDFLKKVKK